ncbi:MAG: hypothetical protein ACI915_004674 [Gammaproteobacteria bacterium]|jgi:hypothetical protein
MVVKVKALKCCAQALFEQKHHHTGSYEDIFVVFSLRMSVSTPFYGAQVRLITVPAGF